MTQYLSRGCEVAKDRRIRKMVAEGNDWQIYLTNVDSYVMAVTEALYERWVADFDLPDGVFDTDTVQEYVIFKSTGNYLVSSLSAGPYPEDNQQIEAFSIAFKTFTKLFPDASLQGAVYIEEYSLLLPTIFDEFPVDRGIAYGQWLTGGVGISITSFDRISNLLPWVPKDVLADAAKKAGFEITGNVERNDDAQGTGLTERKASEGGKPCRNGEVPEEDFVLVGRPELERFFNENIIDVVRRREQYERMGIGFPGGTLLHGKPGCGKTFAVDRLAEYLGWPRYDIDANSVASPYIHDTSKKVGEVFKAAMDTAPSILVIDEMEAFLSKRSGFGVADHHIEEVAEFLRRIPEAISKNVLVFAMTNMIDQIDPAILRRGRFDHIIEVKMASAEEIESMLLTEAQKLPIEDAVDFKRIASELEGRPLSDVSFVLREAGKSAIKQDKAFIDEECFNEALRQLPGSEKKRRPIGFRED